MEARGPKGKPKSNSFPFLANYVFSWKSLWQPSYQKMRRVKTRVHSRPGRAGTRNTRTDSALQTWAETPAGLHLLDSKGRCWQGLPGSSEHRPAAEQRWGKYHRMWKCSQGKSSSTQLHHTCLANTFGFSSLQKPNVAAFHKKKCHFNSLLKVISSPTPFFINNIQAFKWSCYFQAKLTFFLWRTYILTQSIVTNVKSSTKKKSIQKQCPIHLNRNLLT